MTELRFFQHRSFQYSGGTLRRHAAQCRRKRHCRCALDAGVAILPVVLSQEFRAFAGAERGAISISTALRSAAVREVPNLYCDGVADYEAMARQGEFQTGIERLVADATRCRGSGRICLMCAERDPLDCHRCLLVARVLVARNFTVAHILYDGTIESHAATEGRLLDLAGGGIDASDLFATGQRERFAAAYRRRARAVAFRPPAMRRQKA